jgi:hypothetical protein
MCLIQATGLFVSDKFLGESYFSRSNLTVLALAGHTLEDEPILKNLPITVSQTTSLSPSVNNKKVL